MVKAQTDNILCLMKALELLPSGCYDDWAASIGVSVITEVEFLKLLWTVTHYGDVEFRDDGGKVVNWKHGFLIKATDLPGVQPHILAVRPQEKDKKLRGFKPMNDWLDVCIEALRTHMDFQH